MIKIGIIKEEKVPVDHRVPITPAQAAQIQRDFPKVQIKVQSSSVRCYPDDDYRNEGIEIVSSVKDCDILSMKSCKSYKFFN